MRIALFTYGDKTGSIYIMCEDLKVAFEALGHEVGIVTRLPNCLPFSPDLLLVFSPRDMMRAQHQAGRWWYCGTLANVFSMSCETYTLAMMAGFLTTATAPPDGMGFPKMRFYPPMICISKAIYDDLMLRAKAFLNPALFRKFQQKMLHIDYGVLDIYEYTKKTDLDAFIAPLTRLTEDKRFADHQQTTIRLQAIFRLHGYEPRTTVYVAGNTLSRADKVSTDGYEVKPLIRDRAVYAAELQKYAFAICTCHFESFGLYYVELILSGVIVIFSEYEWVFKLLPTYPRELIVSHEDLPAAALHVRRKYDTYFERVKEEVVPFLRQNYLISQFAEKVIESLGPYPERTALNPVEVSEEEILEGD